MNYRFSFKNQNFATKLLLGFVIIEIVLQVIFYSFIQNNKRFIATNSNVDNTREVLLQSELLWMEIKNIEPFTNGNANKDYYSFYEQFSESTLSVLNYFDDLKTLLKNNSEQLSRLDTLNRLIVVRLKYSSEQLELMKSLQLNDIVANRFLDNVNKTNIKIKNIIRKIKWREEELSKNFKIENEKYLTRIEIMMYLLELAILLLLVFMFRSIVGNFNLRRNAENHLIELNKELEFFANTVSHELQSPLSNIVRVSKEVLDTNKMILNDESIFRLKYIYDDSQKMIYLINNLLNFSKSTNQEIRKSVIDMKIVIRDMVFVIQKRESSKLVNVIYKNMLPVIGDTNLISDVLRNILSNAFKYASKKENPTIEINSYSEGNEVVYSFKDNGEGFDMKDYKKLFSEFQRLHPAKDFAGSGIGLSIVQRIITRHKGKVWAEGIIGQGATFYFSLPKS